MSYTISSYGQCALMSIYDLHAMVPISGLHGYVETKRSPGNVYIAITSNVDSNGTKLPIYVYRLDDWELMLVIAAIPGMAYDWISDTYLLTSAGGSAIAAVLYDIPGKTTVSSITSTMVRHTKLIISGTKNWFLRINQAAPRAQLFYLPSGQAYNLGSSTSVVQAFCKSPNNAFVCVVRAATEVFNTETRALALTIPVVSGIAEFAPASDYFLSQGSGTVRAHRVSNWSLAWSASANYLYFCGDYVVLPVTGGLEVRRVSTGDVVWASAEYSTFLAHLGSDRVVIKGASGVAYLNISTGEAIDLGAQDSTVCNVYPSSGKFYLNYVTRLYSINNVASYIDFQNTFSAVESPDGSVIFLKINNGGGYLLIDNITGSTIFSGVGNVYNAIFSSDSKSLLLSDNVTKKATLYRKLNTTWNLIYSKELPLQVFNGNIIYDIFGEAPIISGTALNVDGSPANVEICVTAMKAPQLSVVSQTDPATGKFLLGAMTDGAQAVMIADNRDGVYKVPTATIQAIRGQESKPVVLRLSNAGNRLPIGGNATKASGAAVDSVSVLDWSTSEVVAKVTPEANGDWSAEVQTGQYGLLYQAEGCAPVTHGPYTVSAS